MSLKLLQTGEWCAEYKYESKLLPGGVTKRTKIRETNDDVRLWTGVFTLGLTEVLAEHRVESCEFYYGDEYLGKTENEAADAANNKAVALFNQNNFQEAEKLFNAAYQTCHQGYTNEELFKKNIQAAKDAAVKKDTEAKEAAERKQADEWQHMGNIAAAENRAVVAENRAVVAENRAVDAENRAVVAENRAVVAEKRLAAQKKAKEDAAESLNSEGIEFYHKGNFLDAQARFSAAFLICENGYTNQKVFKKNIQAAKDAVMKKDTEAKEAAERKKADEWQHMENIAAAENRAVVAENRAVVAEKRLTAQKKAKEDAAESLNSEGIEFYRKGNFLDAQARFNAAFLICENGYTNQQLFKENSDAAKIATDQMVAEQKKVYEEQHMKIIAAAEKKAADAEKRAAAAEQMLAEQSKVAEDQRIRRIAAENKAADAEKMAAAAEQRVAEQSKVTEDQRIRRIAAEKRAADVELYMGNIAAAEKKVAEQKKVEEDQRTGRVATEKKTTEDCTVKIEVEKKTAEEPFTKTGTRWKETAEKIISKPPATTIVTRWREIVEALRLNEQGLRLYREGKLTEAAAEIESALDKYEQAVSKFDEASMKQPLDIIFNSFLMVIAAFIENKAYAEAQKTIDYAKGHFPEKTDSFVKAELMIEDDDWEPDYTKQYLVKLDEQSLQNNIMEQLDGY